MTATAAGLPSSFLQVLWLNTGWFEGPQDFWNDFCRDGKLENIPLNEDSDGVIASATRSKFKIGSLGINHNILPGEEKIFEFILTWYFPNNLIYKNLLVDHNSINSQKLT